MLLLNDPFYTFLPNVMILITISVTASKGDIALLLNSMTSILDILPLIWGKY